MNSERVQMTDVDFLLAVLKAGPATTTEILRQSYAERGCGLMVHSRAADLRSRGYRVDCNCVGRVAGRNLFEYRLAALSESSPPSEGSDSGASAPSGMGAAETPGYDTLPPTAAPVSEQTALELPGSVFRKDEAA